MIKKIDYINNLLSKCEVLSIDGSIPEVFVKNDKNNLWYSLFCGISYHPSYMLYLFKQRRQRVDFYVEQTTYIRVNFKSRLYNFIFF